MLLEKPVGAGKKEIALWTKLKPLTVFNFVKIWQELASQESINWIN